MITVLAYYTGKAWHALSQTARGEAVGGNQGVSVDPGPAVILMIGGLTTFIAVLSLFMAKRSLGSEPDPVNTRESKRKATDAVDVYVNGSQSPSDADQGSDAPASSPTLGPSAEEGPEPDEDWTTTTAPTLPEAGTAQVQDAPQNPREGTEPVGSLVVQVNDPDAKPPPGQKEATPIVATPNHAFARGRLAGERVDATDDGRVLRCLVEAGLGTPAIVRSTPNLFVIRLEDCQGCRPRMHHDSDHEADEGCPFEAGFLEGVMSQVTSDETVVRETACRRWGDEACDFEVWY